MEENQINLNFNLACRYHNLGLVNWDFVLTKLTKVLLSSETIKVIRDQSQGKDEVMEKILRARKDACLLYTSPSPRD